MNTQEQKAKLAVLPLDNDESTGGVTFVGKEAKSW